jgi:hypothetical protein
MEDRGRHRIGISQNQPHINADVAPQIGVFLFREFRNFLKDSQI